MSHVFKRHTFLSIRNPTYALQKADEKVQAEQREQKRSDAARTVIKIMRHKKLAVAQADYQRNKAAGVLRYQGAQLA